MTRVAKSWITSSLIKLNLPPCERCLDGKARRKHFDKIKCASAPLDLIYSDICGPISVKVRTRHPYCEDLCSKRCHMSTINGYMEKRLKQMSRKPYRRYKPT